MSASFEASGTPGTASCKVKLDGQEIQNALSGFTIWAEPGAIGVELQVPVVEGLDFSTPDARVYIPDSTRDLLLKLGWTPPKETP